MCFQTPCTHIMVLAGRERLHLSLSHSLSLSGLWRRESLLRILALLHHNTHDVSTFHTHFLPTTIKNLSAHAWQQTRTPRCTGERRELDPSVPPPLKPRPPPTCSPCKSPVQFFFSSPPDLKIAGNSIFILLSKNFFLSYRAPLPNFRTSRGAPARSSPAFWAAAKTGKIVSTVIIHVQKHIG